jgi:hypothetical protein
MAVAFAAGATCCLIGPFPGYLALVGPVADSLTSFVGSLLFTAGGALTAGAACFLVCAVAGLVGGDVAPPRPSAPVPHGHGRPAPPRKRTA